MEEQKNITETNESHNTGINDEINSLGRKWFEKYFLEIDKISKGVCTSFFKKNDRCVALRFKNDTCGECGKCEDCEQDLSVKIMKDNYKVVREFDGRNSEIGTEIFEHFMNVNDFLGIKGRNNSTFATYLTNSLRNFVRDEIIRKEKGNIRPPTVAVNLGPNGVKIWQLMYSEKLTLEQVIDNIDESQSGAKERDPSSTKKSDFSQEIEAYRGNNPTKSNSEIYENISHEDAKNIYEKIREQKKISRSKKTFEFNDSTNTYSDSEIK